MQRLYSLATFLRVLLLLCCLSLTGWAQTTNCACRCIPKFSIAGPDVLTKTDLYYLTSTSDITGPINWTASPSNLFTTASATNSSTLLTAPASCANGPAVITATFHLTACPDSLYTLRKNITVQGNGSTSGPTVRGTYYCTTCADQSTKTLGLDGNTNNVAYYGTYRIDLTSTSSQDTFRPWETFETGGLTLRMVPGTNNRSGLIDLTPNASLASLAATATNTCNNSTRQIFRFSAMNAQRTQRTMASPNPAASEVRIVAPLAQETSSTAATPPQCTARLLDSYGREAAQGQGILGSLRLDVHALPDGLYVLRTLLDTGEQWVERIRIAH